MRNQCKPFAGMAEYLYSMLLVGASCLPITLPHNLHSAAYGHNHWQAGTANTATGMLVQHNPRQIPEQCHSA